MADEELINTNPEQNPDGTENGSKGKTSDFKAHKAKKNDKGAAKNDKEAAAASRIEQEVSPLGFTVETAKEEQRAPALMYPVVGFGASAGGLQAFKEILENLDPNTGMSFVLVTHLAPDQKSFLSEIVERYTQMPVVAIEDGLRPEPNHLYILQPNQVVLIPPCIAACRGVRSAAIMSTW